MANLLHLGFIMVFSAVLALNVKDWEKLHGNRDLESPDPDGRTYGQDGRFDLEEKV